MTFTRAQHVKELAEGAVEVVDRLIRLSDQLQDGTGGNTEDEQLRFIANQFVTAGVSMRHFDSGPSALVQWASDLAHPGIYSAELDEDRLVLSLYAFDPQIPPVMVPLTLFHGMIAQSHVLWGSERWPVRPLALVKGGAA